MPAMTMPFKLRDLELLRGKAAGDLIAATLVVSATDARLTRLDKTGVAPVPDGVPTPSAARSDAHLVSVSFDPDSDRTADQILSDMRRVLAAR